MLIDTHCHIHDADYPLDAEEVLARARQAGVTRVICVGTDVDNSRLALDFASKHDNVYAAVGIHPHYAAGGIGELEEVIKSADKTKLVAIGEIGLDYYYDNSPRDDQIRLLKQQIKLALKYKLPLIFHVRDAYDDFWPIIDESKDLNGVLHCFTSTTADMQCGLDRGFFFGVNGISTFTKDESQKAMFTSIPADKILLETDAPYLTPTPFRGKVKANEPAFIKNIGEYNSELHQISFDEISAVTTANACKLFKL